MSITLFGAGAFEMSKKEKEFTLTLRCDHCGNTAPMEVLARHSTVKTYDDMPRSNLVWDCGDIFELLLCPACDLLTLRRHYWHDQAMDPSDIEFITLYPTTKECPVGLPDKMQRAYDAAQKVRSIDANAYGVLLGRLLELVCVDRNAEGRYLGNKLADLADKKEIPDKLVGVAMGLKDLRNIGAHSALGELTQAEIPILDNLCRAILEYVYSAPSLAKTAEDRFNQLKASEEGGEEAK